MSFSPLAFAFQIANFLVVLWALRRWLYRPFLAAIDARRAELAEEREAARRAQADAETTRAVAEEARRRFEAEKQNDLAAARNEAAAERTRIIDAARTEAQARLQSVERRLASERIGAQRAIRSEATAIGIDIAERVLGALPASALDRGFIEAVDKWLSNRDAERNRTLFGSARSVRIATGSALDDEIQGLWTKLLARYTEGTPAVEFAIDPAIGSGVEIDLPGGNLRFSLRAAAEDIRKSANHD